MKLVTKEEREAHSAFIIAEGAKGLFYGGIASLGLFYYLKKKHTVRFNSFNTSIKTCILTIPTIGAAALWADEGSIEFDRRMYSSEYSENKVLEDYREWNNLSMSDKIFTSLNEHKYKIILASWAGSLWGSWVLVNRDKIMTTAQKAVQARMYAQAISILLLLGTLLLAMKEEEINKAKPPPIPEWKKVLLEKESQHQAEKKAEEARLLKEIEAKQAHLTKLESKSETN